MEPSPSVGLGVQRYVDSPVFIDIVLALFGFALAFGAWSKYIEPDHNLIVVGGLIVGALLCLVSIFAQKRRTFAFDATARKLEWTSHGLRERTGGTVDFNDVRITLDPSIDESHKGYRIMINTPQGSWPLTTGYDANEKNVEAKATQLRSLLGQSSETLLDDSVAELKKQGNLLSAATIVGRQRGVPTAQAFGDLTQAQGPDMRQT
ncbi:MAG TPA: hypothetical protein VFO25_00115 [Candidatus Eremiobacteraceae bacterium]|nr:hypothetical protein [Candidatus Eremiobacteraceae bacterium]